MKHIRTIAILLLALPVVWSCAPQQNLRPIENQSEPQNFMGLFVIMPPQGNEWYEVVRKSGILAYGKKLESNKHTFIASAQVSRIDKVFNNENEFLSFVKTSRVGDTDQNKFSGLTYKEEIDNTHGNYCTRYLLKAEEKGKGTIESNGYTCLHPMQPQLVVTVEYSERTQDITVGNEIRNEGEQFIKSLKLKLQ